MRVDAKRSKALLVVTSSCLNLRDNAVTTRRENESRLGAFLINKTVQQAHPDSVSLKLYRVGYN